MDDQYWEHKDDNQEKCSEVRRGFEPQKLLAFTVDSKSEDTGKNRQGMSELLVTKPLPAG